MADIYFSRRINSNRFMMRLSNLYSKKAKKKKKKFRKWIRNLLWKKAANFMCAVFDFSSMRFSHVVIGSKRKKKLHFVKSFENEFLFRHTSHTYISALQENKLQENGLWTWRTTTEQMQKRKTNVAHKKWRKRKMETNKYQPQQA